MIVLQIWLVGVGLLAWTLLFGAALASGYDSHITVRDVAEAILVIIFWPLVLIGLLGYWSLMLIFEFVDIGYEYTEKFRNRNRSV